MLATLLLACAETALAPVGATPLRPGDPHVLVIVLDGVRVDETTSTTPSDLTGVTGEQWASNLWADLAPDATVVRSILNPVLTSTAPGHAAMLIGRPEPLFTVGFQVGAGPGLYRPQIPTIFEAARDQLGWSAADTTFLANTPVPESVLESIYPGQEGAGGTWVPVYARGSDTQIEDDDTRLVDLVRASIEAGPPPFFLVNLHDADRTGHRGEDGVYPNRVAEQDAAVAELWRWLTENHPDYVDGLLLVVTADHGRHRHDLDMGWTGHGDSCDGCREVPLFLAGEGVAKGVVAEGTYTLLDLAPTFAAHLGIDLPWAHGLPLTPLVEGGAPGRTGEVDVSVSAGRVATRAWRDDFTARSEVRVDGVPVSTPGVFAAEAPTLLVGTLGTFVCHRELAIEPVDGNLPWRARCLVETEAGWEELGFPDENVGPFWRADLFEHDGALWAAWVHTPLFRDDSDALDGVRLARWTPDRGWWPQQHVEAYHTLTDVAAAPTADGFLAAGVVNLPDPDEPYTRRASVWSFDAQGADERGRSAFPLDALLDEPRRVERPAIRAVGDTVDLAMLGVGADARFVAVARSTDGGVTWTEATALPAGGGALLVHVTPQWDGDHIVWGALLDDGTSGLCRATLGGTTTCVSTGSPRLDSFDVEAGVATVSVDTGVGQWELGDVRW